MIDTMLDKVKAVWKVVVSVFTVLATIASAPSKVAALHPVYQFLANHWASLWFRALFAAFAVSLIYVFEIVDFFLPTVKITPTASGGYAPRVVLRVTNDGNKATFRATAEIVGSRHAGMQPTNYTAELRWENRKDPEAVIGRKAGLNLLIAYTHTVTQDLSELRLFSVGEDADSYFASARWNVDPQEKLPELDLKVSVYHDLAKGPAIGYFTVRPEKYFGPLEMVKCEVPA
jgi:hypothetical protein